MKRNRHCCDSCNYSTGHSRDLIKHKKRHSCNEKFRCPRCTYSSKQQGKIKLHLKRDHCHAAPLHPMAQQSQSAKEKTGLLIQEQLEIPSVSRYFLKREYYVTRIKFIVNFFFSGGNFVAKRKRLESDAAINLEKDLNAANRKVFKNPVLINAFRK